MLIYKIMFLQVAVCHSVQSRGYAAENFIMHALKALFVTQGDSTVLGVKQGDFCGDFRPP